METKLTLKLDIAIIEKAKKYAKYRKKSLSGLVEDYFRGLGADGADEDEDIAPIVRELSGIVAAEAISGWDKEYALWLEEKYG